MTSTFFGWEEGINVWVNHQETQHVFEKIAKSLNTVARKDLCFITKELYATFPTSKKFNDDGLLLASIFYKIFAQNGLAVKDGNVYRRIKGTRFSWEKWMPLNPWVTQKFTFDKNFKFLQMLKDHASWIYNQGVRKKNDLPFNLFPKLSTLNFLIEFNDKLFEFTGGGTLYFKAVEPQTATLCFVDNTFDQCRPPYATLGLFHCLVSWGQDITTEWQQIAQKPKQNWDRYDEGRFQQMKASQKRFEEALQTFGGIFHPTHNRKKNKALYLKGAPSTYKTFLIRTLFNKIIGLDSVDIVDRHKNRFNTSNLRKDDQQPYVLIIDDLRWNSLGMHIPDFLNLLDGHYVRTEKKFQQPQSGPLKGVIAITSNEIIGGNFEDTNCVVDTDRHALTSRLQEVELFQLRLKQKFIITDEVLQDIENEAVGFSILINAAFLAKNPLNKPGIQLPQTFLNCDQIINQNDNPFQAAGKIHMKQFLKKFYEEEERE